MFHLNVNVWTEFQFRRILLYLHKSMEIVLENSAEYITQDYLLQKRRVNAFYLFYANRITLNREY